MNRIITLGKALRKRPTDAEQLLWMHLRMKQMEGLKFRRQQPIDNYIVDFVCFESRIIIEVDGGQHVSENHKDKERDSYFQQFGFKVIRFWNNEVLQNTNGVLEIIRDICLSHPPLNPLPSREGKISGVFSKMRKRYPFEGKKSRASSQGKGKLLTLNEKEPKYE